MAVLEAICHLPVAGKVLLSFISHADTQLVKQCVQVTQLEYYPTEVVFHFTGPAAGRVSINYLLLCN